MSKNERNVVCKVVDKVEDVVTKVIDKNPNVNISDVIMYTVLALIVVPFVLKFFNIL